MHKSTDVLVEVLGCPSEEMHEPVNAGYHCPFFDTKCTKRGHHTGDPFPLCSLWKHSGRGDKRQKVRPVVVCPKRFFQADLVDDILEHCWVGDYNREHIEAVREIKMGKAGNVDMVICDTSDYPDINRFISVELQAVDITGSVSSAYTAHLNGQDMSAMPKYSFNMSNVFKRYLTQLIKKGYFHSTWDKKIVAVVQDFLLEDIRKRIKFAPSDPKDESTSIVFMSYALDTSERDEEGYYRLKLQDVVGAQHSVLMNAVVYETPPKLSDFMTGIRRQLEE